MREAATIVALALALGGCPGPGRTRGVTAPDADATPTTLSPVPPGPRPRHELAAGVLEDGLHAAALREDVPADPWADDDGGGRQDADPLGLETSAAEREQALHQALERARSRLDAGDPKGAATAARAAFDLDGRSVEAIKLLISTYLARGWDLEARQMLLEVTGWLGAGAKSPELWFLLGRSYERSGEIELATNAYDVATGLRPSYGRAWNNLGVVLLRRGTVVRAVEALENALSLDGESSAIQTNLGTAYRRSALGESNASKKAALLRKAERAYQVAIDGAVARGDSYPPAYFDLGLLYLEAKAFPGLDDSARLLAAVRNLEKFQKLAWTAPPETGADGDPIDVEALLQLAQKKLREAQQKAERGDKGKSKGRGAK